ncbi:MAG: hypothetical protein MRY64_04650 [Hyphomonadaceae bacterium]|nr:hypothetical protein [Hyphomonadaceae bacterium]
MSDAEPMTCVVVTKMARGEDRAGVRGEPAERARHQFWLEQKGTSGLSAGMLENAMSKAVNTFADTGELGTEALFLTAGELHLRETGATEQDAASVDASLVAPEIRLAAINELAAQCIAEANAELGIEQD